MAADARSQGNPDTRGQGLQAGRAHLRLQADQGLDVERREAGRNALGVRAVRVRPEHRRVGRGQWRDAVQDTSPGCQENPPLGEARLRAHWGIRTQAGRTGLIRGKKIHEKTKITDLLNNFRFNNSNMVLDHIPGTLSELERRMERHIPPGGNWTHIPEDIPSDRLAQIREMAKNRGMVRTTYYGRLHPDRPSYTINTYFSRLGNGTHLHYDNDQHRLITIREGARFQTLPDSYIFEGSKTSKFTQIGNAVPPLLVYQIACRMNLEGRKSVDLFCGAGGMSLGLGWAGVSVEVAVDNAKHAMATFARNHQSSEIILGNLKSTEIMEQVLSESRGRGVDLVVGGPPCQGFSMAGWRNPEDKRNLLFRRFHHAVEDLSPAQFIMENVPGILSANQGKTFKTIRKSFESLGYTLSVFKLKSELYGIPQRRTRIFIIGDKHGKEFAEPLKLTNSDNTRTWVGAYEALGDLPKIRRDVDTGEYILDDQYIGSAMTGYQKFMRDEIDHEEYLDSLSYEE